MAKPHKPADAWDDDWESQADRAEQEPPAPEVQKPLTKRERWAKHAEFQRRLWEDAETPDEPNYITMNNTVPLATGFKPAVKLLSRKPAPQMIARRDPVTGMAVMTLQDDEDDEDGKQAQPTTEEIRKKQQREREEKQRRYNEARAKIFGEPATSSGASSPGTTTPPDVRQNQRGRGRGGRGGGRNESRYTSDARQEPQGRRPAAAPQPPAARELFDPGYSPRPGVQLQKRGSEPSSQSSPASTPRPDEQPIRAPRGPDSSGRAGFGPGRPGPQQD